MSFLKNGELTPKARIWCRLGVAFYIVLLVLMCFTPQVSDGIETPGIQHFGRVVVLLVPFNSLVNLGQVTSIFVLVKIFLQNLANIFLLSPLVIQLLFLFPSLRSVKRVIWLSFFMSLGIELTQILLDILLDVNRVFEIDDLWTNTLGGYLAYLLFKKIQERSRHA